MGAEAATNRATVGLSLRPMHCGSLAEVGRAAKEEEAAEGMPTKARESKSVAMVEGSRALS